MSEFVPFPKIPRLNRPCVVTEKLDGTNVAVVITQTEDEQYVVAAQSRNRLITPGKTTDNHGFAQWVENNAQELKKLGVGHHFGEWWGQGIARHYGLSEKRFSLFNTARWSDPDVRPSVCHVVPVLYEGPFDTTVINDIIWGLRDTGSEAAPGFMNPEGVVVYHQAANSMFKVTVEKDDQWKGKQ